MENKPNDASLLLQDKIDQLEVQTDSWTDAKRLGEEYWEEYGEDLESFFIGAINRGTNATTELEMQKH